ncbi:hypothetical protein [Streptomyces sp. WZ-12]|uniref:hypothetical protein n=1 Tax=Streptomyces sp. WZ-12 TaxID=3030210 RepID=UPI0023816C6C|nr:hypothetical protein [Streptomyces sp. WZ-12]
MKSSRISPASHTSLRAICTAAALAAAMAVPTTAFAAGTPGQQGRPAPAGTAHTTPQAPAKNRVRAVGIGGGMEAVIHNGVCDLQAVGSGKPFMTLKKGQSYTKGIRVHFDGTHVNAKAQGASRHGRVKPEPARTVTLANGARAIVQKVNGSYTAKIQVKNKQIATLSSTRRSVTHEGVRYTVNPTYGKVTVQRLTKRQQIRGTQRRVIHLKAQSKRLPQRHVQAPVTSYAQPPVAGQAQAPLTGQAQAPVYGGWPGHRTNHPAGGAQAGAVAMSFSAAGAGAVR